MRRKLEIFLFLIIILVGCKNENNYIIPADFSLLFPDSTMMTNGITENQIQKRTGEFITILTKNTLNKEIPNADIIDLNGKTVNLKEQLSNKKLIILSSLTCAWDLEGLLNDFPRANKLINHPIEKSKVILLIKNEKSDYFEKQFKRNIKEIEDNYSNIYLIDSIQLLKLNMLGLTRYYISKEQLVLDIGRGTSSIERLQNELERNTVANSK